MPGLLPRVLVVDDEASIVEMLQKTLERDFDVVGFVDPLAALEALRRERVAAILADHMMPGLTGIELLTHALEQQPQAVRILLTATDRIEHLLDAVNRARVHRFLSKPIRLMELRGVVEGAVREATREEELRKKSDVLERALEAVKAHEHSLEKQIEERGRELRVLRAELEARKSGQETNRSVLVVDPDASATKVFVEMLIQNGFDVALVRTAAEARARLARTPVDIVVADRVLPDGSGPDLVEEFRDSEAIVVGTFEGVDDVVRTMSRNVADVFVKPLVDPVDLLARVRKALARLLDRRKEREKLDVLQNLATRDPLTGLFNHAFLQESLEREVHRASRYRQEFSLLFVDIDHFKEVNDNVGHPAGDACLKAVAEVLSGRVRKTDLRFRLNVQDVAARYGGDEFALILPETPKLGAAAKAEQLRRLIEGIEPASIGFRSPTVSIGVASFPADASDRDGLLAAADMALYAAKRRGRNTIVSYSLDLGISSETQKLKAVDREIERITELDRTIAEHDFDFAYQPIVNVVSGDVFAYEALCRPRSKMLNTPSSLFEIAERAGRILDLGRACRQESTKCLDSLPAPQILFLNLHPYEMHDERLLASESPLHPWSKRLVFEITETAAIRNRDRLREIIETMQAKGYRIALDDLGAGYQGLNSLALLRPDFVKLDMELIRSITHDSRQARLVKHILEFAVGEGMEVIAEGVETDEECRVVRELGCPLIQGYFFARPGPAFGRRFC